MAQEQESCSVCGSLMTTIPWNSTTDISFCENLNCSRYHVPVKPKPGAQPTRKRKTRVSDVSSDPNPYVLRVKRLRDKILYGDDDE